VSSWVELSVVVPRLAVPRLARLALDLGASGVQEAPPPGERPVLRQPWDTEAPPESPTSTLLTWVPPAQAEVAHRALEAAVGQAVGVRSAEDTDWSTAWRQHHEAVEVGSLRVSPPWLAVDGDLVIPPGQAFGTGDHPTTRSCLQALVELAPGARSCLDVGCGSGVLALAAARLGLAAEGVDIDAIAVATARDNAVANGLAVSFSTAPLDQLEGPYDVVVANLYAEVLTVLAPDLVRLTGGWLVLAGILHDRAAAVQDALQPELEFVSAEREGDWLHLRCRRP